MPQPSSIHETKRSSSHVENLPELPSLGAVATRSVLSSHGHDELFGEIGTSTAVPLPIEEIPLSSDLDSLAKIKSPEPPVPDFSARIKPTLDIPHIPKMDLPAAEVEEIHLKSKEVPGELPNDPGVISRKASVGQAIPETTIKLTPSPPTSTLRVSSELQMPEDSPAQKTPTPEKQKKATAQAKEQAREQEKQFTDEDLQEALRPFIEPSVDQFLYTPKHSIHSYLEPMLRSTVRRAIAEQMEDASPFRDVSGWDRFTWKLRALMGSRTYEDILFDQTRRYQVEEVFLLRPKTRSLISYASHDPSRHSKPSKVEGTVKNIATKIAHKPANDSSPIKWETHNRQLLIRYGNHCMLAAIVHGAPNAILRADLDYAVRQAEDRFGETLEEGGDIHLQILQPLLEGCLLIQSTAVPN